MSDTISHRPRALHSRSAPGTVAIPGYLAGTWKPDPVHSEIAFSIQHLMISKVRGRFTSYDVTIVTGEVPLSSTVTATIDLASLDTGTDDGSSWSPLQLSQWRPR